MPKNKIIPQMFDVKPVDETGALDWKRINSVGGRNFMQGEYSESQELQFKEDVNDYNQCNEKEANVYILGVPFESKKAPVFYDSEFNINEIFEKENEDFVQKMAMQEETETERIAEYDQMQQEKYEELMRMQYEELEREKAEWLEKELRAEEENKRNEEIYIRKGDEKSANILWKNIFFPSRFLFRFNLNKSLVAFTLTALAMSLGIGGISYVNKGLSLKSKVLGVSQDGYSNISAAINDLSHQNFEGSSQQFSQAHLHFSEGTKELENMGGLILDATRFIPFASKISSGKNAVEAGKHFSAAGQSINEVIKLLAEIKNPIIPDKQSDASLLEIFKSVEKNISESKKELDLAQQNIDLISVDDLPEDKRDKFILLREKLPEIRSTLESFLSSSHIFTDLLGGNGPRKYLFLFQNNSEMRATGGFIGSYGLLSIINGHVNNFFIDGIFNPDGQLREKIVPPQPIQKISAAWSMHDSNWFPDFPKSAQKAMMFYEKTGGPTTDGVITFTPTLMQKLLEITGPIEMPEYGVTLDADNFIELTQYKVEVDYDKKENKPKKILADLAPIVLEKLFSNKDLKSISKTADVFLSSLEEKHMLLYSQNRELESIISEQGWSGEVLNSSKDYLSVINTNINGFKTDAVIEEKIEHIASLQSDGSVIDTVTITRKHTGGKSDYEWLNKVNANYMRVYVPLGSKLLEASGQTRESNLPPLDYNALGFKRDSDVQNEENGIKIDQDSGTRIYEDSGKTVFANWTYVSPQEETIITYKYLLPFTLFKISVGNSRQADSYSLVVQKQSGSTGSSFISDIIYPSDHEVKWSFPEEFKKSNNKLRNKTTLERDRFEGVVFEKIR